MSDDFMAQPGLRVFETVSHYWVPQPRGQPRRAYDVRGIVGHMLDNKNTAGLCSIEQSRQPSAFHILLMTSCSHYDA